MIASLHQRAYDALAGRLGVRIGTFRIVPLATSLALLLASIPRSAWDRPSTMLLPATLGLALVSFLHRHLAVENRMQAEGRAPELNSEARYFAEEAWYLKFLVLAGIAGAAAIAHTTPGWHGGDLALAILGCLALLSWAYAVEVRVPQAPTQGEPA